MKKNIHKIWQLRICYYKSVEDLMMDQGSLAVKLGIGASWKVIYSGKVTKLIKQYDEDAKDFSHCVVIKLSDVKLKD